VAAKAAATNRDINFIFIVTFKRVKSDGDRREFLSVDKTS
jgi:hypothetical protein